MYLCLFCVGVFLCLVGWFGGFFGWLVGGGGIIAKLSKHMRLCFLLNNLQWQ